MNLSRSLLHGTRRIVMGLGWIALIVYAATTDAVQTAELPHTTQPLPVASHAPHRTLLFVRPAAGGLVIGIDRETGMLVVPEPELLAQLLAARENGARAAKAAPVRHADGSYSL